MSGWDSPRQAVELAWEKAQKASVANRTAGSTPTGPLFDPEAPVMLEENPTHEERTRPPCCPSATSTPRPALPKSIFDPTVLVPEPQLDNATHKTTSVVTEPDTRSVLGGTDARPNEIPMQKGTEYAQPPTQVCGGPDTDFEVSDSEQEGDHDGLAQSSAHKKHQELANDALRPMGNSAGVDAKHGIANMGPRYTI